MTEPRSQCPIHGWPSKRADCRRCNAAYMRDYMRRRRLELPAQALCERARKRALSAGLPFKLKREDIIIPIKCPVLGISLTIGGSRSASSPSLDRIDPEGGYVPGNIRVISDRANRLKSNRSLSHIRKLAVEGNPAFRAEYRKIADYMAREGLLQAIRIDLEVNKRISERWECLLPVIDEIFAIGLVSNASGERWAEELRFLTDPSLDPHARDSDHGRDDLISPRSMRRQTELSQTVGCSAK